MTEPKFRPYFTLSELSEIIDALKTSPTPARISLIRYLEQFKIKCEHGLISSGYTPNPRDSMSQKLGFDESNSELAQKNKSKYMEAAYQKQIINPKACSPHEISLAMEYRYLNDMMSEREESEYEHTILGVKTS